MAELKKNVLGEIKKLLYSFNTYPIRTAITEACKGVVSPEVTDIILRAFKSEMNTQFTKRLWVDSIVKND